MELSTFEKLVISRIVEGDPEQAVLEAQLKSVVVTGRDYTGVGLYTKLGIASTAPLLSRSSRYIEEVPKVHLTHPDLPQGAGALLWISDFRLGTLECYTYDGDWPQDEDRFEVTK